MPQPATRRRKGVPTTPSAAKVCTALTTSGQPCRKRAVPGLTVCESHGGATAASVRVSKRAVVSQTAHSLWGISSDAGSISVEEELQTLAANKRADIIALRIKISSDDIRKHIGTLTETHTQVEYDIIGTVQSKEGTQETKTRRAAVSVWVKELHTTEVEYLAIMRLLHEVTGGTDELDTKRLRLQTAREAARLAKAYPGMAVDEIAAEVAKGA